MGVIVLPIKPLFAYRIFTRRKRFELRKSRCEEDLVAPGDRAILYVSGSVKAFMGEFTIGSVYKGSPVQIYSMLSRMSEAGVGEEDFVYIQGSRCAIAVEVIDPFLYRKPVEMKEVLKLIPDYNPPLGIQRLDEHDPLVVLVFNKARELSLKHI